jgi:hypothetical protein
VYSAAFVSLPPKHQVALKLLESSGIFIHLDPRHPDVMVPAQFKTQRELVLQFGLNMRVPIKDLEVEPDAICGTLSFSRRPFWCRIPWTAVYAIVSDVDRRGFSWGPGPGPEPPAPPPAAKRSHLRAVGPADSSEEASPEALPAPTGEGTCKVCEIRWPEDVDSCPLCGSTRSEAFVGESAAKAPEAPTSKISSAAPPPPAVETSGEAPPASPPSDTPPDDPPPQPPKRPPFLRLVK